MRRENTRGSVEGTFTPSSTSYQSYATAAFTVTTAGPHTITFQGLDSAGGDNTVFLDAVTISQWRAIVYWKCQDSFDAD